MPSSAISSITVSDSTGDNGWLIAVCMFATIAACSGVSAMPGGLGAMPKMPAGMSGAMPTLPPGMAMPMMPGAVAGGAAGAGALGALMPNVANMPPGMAMTPEQMAMMADLQKAMSEPLSPTETLAVMDEMAELGMLPKAILPR